MGGSDKTEKTTIMVLKVDLQCPCCYKKAKKVLCKMPQVRDQLYDKKANTITITVVCCSPENVRDKLCYKGGKSIQSIEIKEPADNPKVGKNPKPSKNDKTVELPQESKKPQKKVRFVEGTKAAMVTTPWASESMLMMPVQGYPQQPGNPQPPAGCGCGQCYHTGGSCYQYYGTPAPPGPYYGNYSYGYGLGTGPFGYGPGPSGYGKGCYVNSDYLDEENALGCTIM